MDSDAQYALRTARNLDAMLLALSLDQLVEMRDYERDQAPQVVAGTD